MPMHWQRVIIVHAISLELDELAPACLLVGFIVACPQNVILQRYRLRARRKQRGLESLWALLRPEIIDY